MANLWGEKAKVTVLKVERAGHSTLSGVKVVRYRFWVKREDGRKTIVAASKLSKIR